MLKIIKVISNSPAYFTGILKNDIIVSLNNKEIESSLDLHYYSSLEDNLDFILDRGGNNIKITVILEEGADLGLELEEIKIRKCHNNCIFCFVDQMPNNMRKTLYIKDDDYRLSFLHGSYITTTNLKEKDYQKIFSMNLSPLYLSVHATNEDVRKRLFRNKKTRTPIMNILNRFKGNNIDLHLQIVLVPEINDGVNLIETINDLISLSPNVLSLSVVPVGTTAFRKDKDKIQLFNKETAKKTLEIVNDFSKKLSKNEEGNFLYASDELYILAEKEIPTDEYYNDYPQFENGVGLMRSFIDDFNELLNSIKKSSSKNKFIVLTSISASKYINELFKKLSIKTNITFEIKTVLNTVFGNTVTVSGLMCGIDIIANAKGTENCLIPASCINDDGLTLDGMNIKEMETKTGAKIIPVSSPDELLQILE